MTRRTIAALGLLAVAGLPGCSGSRPAVDMPEVTGRVTLNGRPVDKLIMNLTPFTPGEGREDECLVQNGEYRVRLIAARYKVSFTPGPGGPSVPKQCQTAETSNLELDGTKSDLRDFDLR
ncbi:MAG: hypothetical protein JWO38_2442 [Gemmataceae bacterium]|nr:hypothetical protein [Gemmataceae bacterium]